jgi:hypothetical protein
MVIIWFRLLALIIIHTETEKSEVEEFEDFDNFDNSFLLGVKQYS